MDQFATAEGGGVPDGPPGSDAGACPTGSPCDDGDPCTLGDACDAQGRCVGQAGLSTPDGWCWHNPLPHGVRLHGVWAAGAGDYFAVGERGALLRYQKGAGWARFAPLSTERLRGGWGSSPRDVFAVGEGGVPLHYDGTAWSKQSGAGLTGGELFAVHGRTASEVYAAGRTSAGGTSRGLLLRHDGTGWTRASGAPAQPLTALWVSSGGDLLVAGAKDTFAHHRGSTWTDLLPNKQVRNLFGLWGRGNGASLEVWAVGEQGVVHRLRGRPAAGSSPALQSQTLATDTVFSALWGTSGGELVALGWRQAPSGAGSCNSARYDGTSWTLGGSTCGNAVDGAASKEAMVVAGGVWLGAGAKWTSLITGPRPRFSALAGVSRSEVYAVAGAEIYRHDGRTWSVYKRFSGDTLRGVWAGGGALVVSGAQSSGAGVAHHFDGTTWKTHAYPAAHLGRLWGSGPQNLYATAGKRLARFDGTAWRADGPPAVTGLDFSAVWGSGASDVFAAAHGGPLGPLPAIYHFDGTTWTEQLGPTYKNGDQDVPRVLYDLHGSGPKQVVAVGSSNTILRHDGTTWQRVAVPAQVSGFTAV